MSHAETRKALNLLSDAADELHSTLQFHGYSHPTVRIEIAADDNRASNSQIYLRCAPYGDNGSDQWETFPFSDAETFIRTYGFARGWAAKVKDPASYELAKLSAKIAEIRETAKRLELDTDVEAAAGRVVAELDVMAALLSRNAITHQPKRGVDPDRERNGESE